METNSIKQIKECIDKIQSELDGFDNAPYLAQTYGSEKEYTGKSIYFGLNSLLIDVSYLIKAHNIFITISTHTERNEIVNDLNYIHSYLKDPNSLWGYIDSLKIKLRKFNIKNSKDRWELFLEANKKLLEQRDEFDKALKLIEEHKNQAVDTLGEVKEKLQAINLKFEEVEKKIEDVENVNSDVEENSNRLKNINAELSEIKAEAGSILKDITTSFNEAKSNEKIISEFSKNVQLRETKFLELDQATEQNKIKLADYDKERVSVLAEANRLIESAKEALKYKTAEGISASFQTNHEEARRWYFSVIWIVGALAFFCIATGLGIWILQGDTDKLHIILGRVALIPLPILAAFFCANQYVKQKNIIEDYAYKMVLAKSMVGFSEQLKKDPSEDKGEYIHYMKVALEEIHKDPLRKREEKISNSKFNNNSLTEIVELAEKIVRMSKTIE